MNAKSIPILIGLLVFGGIVFGSHIQIVPSFGGGKPVTVNDFKNPKTVRDPNVTSVSCSLDGTKTKNAQNQDVVEFSWTIPTGAIAYIYSPDGDVGYVPGTSDVASAEKLQSLPNSKVSTYTMLVSTGKATTTCQVTI